MEQTLSTSDSWSVLRSPWAEHAWVGTPWETVLTNPSSPSKIFLGWFHPHATTRVPATWHAHDLHKILCLTRISSCKHSSTKGGNLGHGLGSLFIRPICSCANTGAGSKETPYRLSLLPLANSARLNIAWRRCYYAVCLLHYFSGTCLRTQMPHI